MTVTITYDETAIASPGVVATGGLKRALELGLGVVSEPTLDDSRVEQQRLIVTYGIALSPAQEAVAAAIIGAHDAAEYTQVDNVDIRETGVLPNYTSGSATVIKSWAVPESRQLSVKIDLFAVALPEGAGRPRGGSYDGLIHAARTGANAARLVGDTVRDADNVRDDVSARVTGNAIELVFEANYTGGPANVPYVLKYSTQRLITP